ncbi:hypothetical protein CI610_03289 [invertebrate metagenome]|uniref:Uncharacterized protein n=1 Tax=invertebrate metagenome TaxID=1711999 RepID=A0A2H9T3M0_9ZZZZ
MCTCICFNLLVYFNSYDVETESHFLGKYIFYNQEHQKLYNHDKTVNADFLNYCYDSKFYFLMTKEEVKRNSYC